MAKIKFNFDPEKAAEVIIYLAQHVPTPSFMVLAKLIYFIDKTSLESYGRFITGESYYAMEHGPVPTNSYDMMKAAQDTDKYGFKVEQGRVIVPLRSVNLNKLSESDIKCMDQVLNAYGHLPAWHLREISHDAAWEKSWYSDENARSVPMLLEDILATLEEGHELLEYLWESHKVDQRPTTD